MLLELRLFSLLDLLLDASQRLGCSRVGLGSVAQPGVDLVGVVWFHRSACVKLHDGQHNLNVFERQIVHPWPRARNPDRNLFRSSRKFWWVGPRLILPRA